MLFLWKAKYYLLQLRVRATDGGYIPCYSDSVLTVAVTRNNFAPQFIPSNDYVTTILETHSVIQPVYTVTANDRDIQVLIKTYCEKHFSCKSENKL